MIFNTADGILTPCNVARSWHWFRQVTAPCSVACGSASWQWIHQMAVGLYPATWHVLWDDMSLNSPKRPPYWNSTSGFDFVHITTVDMSFGPAPVCEISNRTYPRQKKMTPCRFSRWRISAILDFRAPIMGSLKSPCNTTSYRSSIETMALKCLVFLRKSRFCILATDRQTNRQTDRQTNRWTGPLHEAALTVVSGGLNYISVYCVLIQSSEW